MLMTDLSREGFGRPPLVTPNSFYESGVFSFSRKLDVVPAPPATGRRCSRD